MLRSLTMRRFATISISPTYPAAAAAVFRSASYTTAPTAPKQPAEVRSAGKETMKNHLSARAKALKKLAESWKRANPSNSLSKQLTINDLKNFTLNSASEYLKEFAPRLTAGAISKVGEVMQSLPEDIGNYLVSQGFGLAQSAVIYGFEFSLATFMEYIKLK